ncbi:MAG: hypothetical protein J7545_12840 [Roseofilum sp. SBFL]|uniref:hypothetical protein n=1 Tax=unclassified Roseofilum TaxID=2620099 RepID=UPI001B2B2256|nr:MULTISPECIES: hypothetical protein [unclassified Roseofilum]MBP0014673.1 hypothetical protein [Roseofilum sp. SID3]MBP0023357.1 hypothetical protein [Roseofilum sp. SID2]MBP0039671.1 hypothetical protein [Roseofilum sp. SID1]MBP0042838.1 hypothetical protein [Roseofilum sp. SBFL]
MNQSKYFRCSLPLLRFVLGCFFLFTLPLGKSGLAQSNNLDRLDALEASTQNELHLSQASSFKVAKDFTNRNGTIREGSRIMVDASDESNIPEYLRNRIFVINKPYVVQEGVFYDDLFIVDERGNKWDVMAVSPNNLVWLQSGDLNVWGLWQGR